MNLHAMYLPSSDELAQLVNEFAAAKVAADDAKKKADELNRRLKLAMIESVGATKDEDIPAETVLDIDDTRVTLSRQASTRLDSTRLKAEQPTMWARYAKTSETLVMRIKRI